MEKFKKAIDWIKSESSDEVFGITALVVVFILGMAVGGL